MHLKIGSRKSKLALWQAQHVATKLNNLGHSSELVLIESEGDLVLDTPLPLMGGKGVFTKALDLAILDSSIDIAVHSFKDIPTELDHELTIAAILERENPRDALVAKKGLEFLTLAQAVVATSSNRRKAQWLNRYPHHQIVDIRGNVPTRLQKLNDSEWDATILACAGLIRLNMETAISQQMDWMLPAPAQGAVAIMCHQQNEEVKALLKSLEHYPTALCTTIERDFLNTLNGGCSAPIGAYAQLKEDRLHFEGVVLSCDGSQKIEISLKEHVEQANNLGRKAAQIALNKGAAALIETAQDEKYH